nr:MAG TPA: hypothetical protein [Caudoviricetes sp.]
MSNLCGLLRDYANICLNLSNLQRAKNRGECLNSKSVEHIFRLHKFCKFFEYRGRGGQRDQPASQLYLAKISARLPPPTIRVQTKAARPQKTLVSGCLNY